MSEPVLPVFRTVRVAYRDAWRAARSMPGTVLATLLAVCALQAIRLAAGYAPTLPLRDLPTPEFIQFRSIVEAFSLADMFIQIPVMIGIHSWILLGEARPFDWPARVRSKYFVYFYYVVLFNIPSFIFSIFFHGSELGTLFSSVLSLIYAYIAVRGCLIFSAVAIDRPKTRFVDLFERTKGRFWRTFWILLWVTLPTLASMALVLWVRKLDPPASFVAELLLTGIATLGGFILLASANSHIYRLIGTDDEVQRSASAVEADTDGLSA